VVSGCTWMAIGIMLLVKGLKFIVSTAEIKDAASPLINWLAPLVGTRQQAALLLVSVALLIGFIKGRTILAKTVKRIADRILTAQGDLTMNQAYDRKYYAILAIMVGIGLTFRFLPIAHDIRGFIDVAIGSALINGAMLYFRQAVTCGTYSPG
jgi:hypothetical protein